MIDGTDVIQIEQRLTAACADIASRTAAVATSKQVIEFLSDSRKNLLAKYQMPYLMAGDSATASEIKARADQKYIEELKQLEDMFRRAQNHIEEMNAAMVKFDAARSLLAMARQGIMAGTRD